MKNIKVFTKKGRWLYAISFADEIIFKMFCKRENIKPEQPYQMRNGHRIIIEEESLEYEISTN